VPGEPPGANPKVTPAVAGGDNPLAASSYNGAVSSGSSGAQNLGPRSKTLKQNTQALTAYWHQRGVNPTPDLVTTSGSGYDPDITAADAAAEIPMVSKSTGLSPSVLQALINRQNNGAQLGFLGSSYINVLQLNQALAQLRR
jgi:potassium-transporting ATPase KdpC subunit